MGRPRRLGADLDDWFGESEPKRARTTQDIPRATVPLPSSGERDDWLVESDLRGRTAGTFSELLREWKALFVIVVLTILLVVGLAFGGVFSSHRAPAPTGARSTTVATPPKATARIPKLKKTAPIVPSPAAGPTAALKPGDSGPEVKSLQTALQSLGYLSTPADGGYGPATQAAVARFQAASHLPSDGVFGPATLAALTKVLAGP